MKKNNNRKMDKTIKHTANTANIVRKGLALLVLLATIIVSLTACGGKSLKLEKSFDTVTKIEDTAQISEIKKTIPKITCEESDFMTTVELHSYAIKLYEELYNEYVKENKLSEDEETNVSDSFRVISMTYLGDNEADKENKILKYNIEMLVKDKDDYYICTQKYSIYVDTKNDNRYVISKVTGDSQTSQKSTNDMA